ncbi:hypothetical protein ACS4RR_021065 [Rhizobium sp. Z1P35]
MGERQTGFIMLMWLIATLIFFGLIGFRIWDYGLDWLLHSPESLISVGLIAIFSYIAIMFSQVDEYRKKDNADRVQRHQEALDIVRTAHRLLDEKVITARDAVEELDRKIGLRG